MTNSEFAREQQVRLAIYKSEVLGVTENGTFQGREYAHILPDEAKHLNILDTIRSCCWEYLSEQKTRHDSGLSHLNSSQGLAFNFWYPFCPEGERRLQWNVTKRLFSFLGWDPVEIESAAFEAKRNLHEESEIDWWAETTSGSQIFCETKYTEPFGTAKDNPAYRKQLKDVYKEELAPLVKENTLDDFVFFRKNYQIFRNIWHLPHGKGSEFNRVLFLLPARSPSVRKLDHFIETAIPDGTVAHKRVTASTIEEAAKFMADTSSCLEESRHWRLFLLKYCPWALDDQTHL